MIKNKNLSGMTLVEVICALAVFAVMLLVLATVFKATTDMNLATKTLMKENARQYTIADATPAPSFCEASPDDREIIIKYNGTEVGKIEALEYTIKSEINEDKYGQSTSPRLHYLVKKP